MAPWLTGRATERVGEVQIIMSQQSTLERRLSELEREVAEIKRQVAAHPPAADWLRQMTGAFKDDPEFDEILRLGSEIRKSERPNEKPTGEP